MIEAESLGKQPSIRHGFFTRRGGVSTGIYASLNCGLGSRDAPAAVRDNRARVAARLGVAADRLVTVHQSHSARVVTADASWSPEAAPQADAIVTRRPGLAIAVLTADCAPVLFADDAAGVVGAAHAGWRGARAGIIEATLDAMEALGARRARITAAVGPAISADAYEVGEDFRRAFLESDRENARFFRHKEGRDRPHFDLPAYVQHRLARAGVGGEESVGLCSYGNESLLFSYRRAQQRGEADYGRQISAILVV